MKLADTDAVAALFQVSPATVRSWAKRQRITRRGKDHRGRTLYDVLEVAEYAKRAA